VGGVDMLKALRPKKQNVPFFVTQKPLFAQPTPVERRVDKIGVATA
jgi:hypothetical protein